MQSIANIARPLKAQNANSCNLKKANKIIERITRVEGKAKQASKKQIESR
jgi:hypothetical protein